jgi:Flp pilus assembly protein TadG
MLTKPSRLPEFSSDRSGATALLLALALPALLAGVGGAVEYSSLARQRSAAQNVVDGTALSVARQMTMQRLSDSQVQAIAQNFADVSAQGYGLSGLQLVATVSTDRLGLRIRGSVDAKSSLGFASRMIGVERIEVTAASRVGQETKLCLLSVAETRTTEGRTRLFVSRETVGINIGRDARLSAPDCMLHTNIETKTAFMIGAGAKVNASVLCARGGVQNSGGIVEAPILDSCPNIPNPMDHRAFPSLGQKCVDSDYKDLVRTSGAHVLQPGNYCGNIRISGDAKVRMLPGNYTIQGRLIVSGNAELTGQGVGIYIWGGNSSMKRHAYFSFIENALIDLSAPESGPMAGMLIWEGINGAAADQESGAKDVNFHQIKTMRARRLTGTIYLPGGRLLIDAPGKVAEESDFTVLLVNRLDLEAGPNLVLNSNYAKSRVPVPQGLGSIGARDVRLER